MASPKQFKPIWTPSDAIDTAEVFAAELDHAERGVADLKPRWWLSQSRYRKAGMMDFLAVLLLLATTAAVGCALLILSTGEAKADPSDALAYAAEYGPAVCITLDDYPTSSGIYGISRSIVEQTGMSWRDAGTAIYDSVNEICPRHMGLLMRFVAANTRHTPVAGVA
jgi:hypothetical protein